MFVYIIFGRGALNRISHKLAIGEVSEYCVCVCVGGGGVVYQRRN